MKPRKQAERVPKLEDVCLTCRQEFGDHQARWPHALRSLHCRGFVPLFPGVGQKTRTVAHHRGLPPVNGCKLACEHVFCGLLKAAQC